MEPVTTEPAVEWEAVQATACVWCGVAPGQPCVRLGTTELRTAPHATRIKTAVLVAQAREAGKAEAEFGPLGDNHHNATRCPYCTPTIDAKRAQSAAELLDQFLTALDSWATDGGWSRVYSAAELRWFAEQWLPAGEIPAGLPQPMLDAMEDARCTTTQAAIAHIDALTRERP